MTARPKLSAAQRRALEALRDTDEGTSAYRLRASLNTMEALCRRELVFADRSRPGHILCPAVAILWTLTPAGRALLSETEDG